PAIRPRTMSSVVTGPTTFEPSRRIIQRGSGILLLGEAVAVIVAQLRLEELARRRAGDLLQLEELVGEPELREPRLEVRAQIVEARLLPRLPHDGGDRALGPLVVRRGEHRRLEHRGVRHERVLEGDGADPLAARLDDVLRSIADAHEALGVEGDDVARL